MPAVTVCEGGVADKVKSGVAVTVIVADPVIEAVTVSVAVIVCEPGFFSVAVKVSTPFISVEFAGKVAPESLLVKCTVPE